jgi:predicted benzoate:H+ symporter BenE
VGSLVYAVMQGRWVTVLAFVVTVAGFSLPERGAALLGVALFATDLAMRARKARRTPDPPRLK